nr:MAG TPA: hypothetical protein [Caudoviricetes sp.]
MFDAPECFVRPMQYLQKAIKSSLRTLLRIKRHSGV